MMISGRTMIYGIFGHPVEHTFSPGMHNAAFRKLGIDACYVPFGVPPDRLEDAVRAVSAVGLKGINVTVPHKQNVIPYLNGLSDEAALIGAVNTIEVRQGTTLIGHNTDGRGFLRSLKDNAGFNPNGKRFLFLGSGGAARAVGFSLAIAGAEKIVFMDIDRNKADSLANDISTKVNVSAEAISIEELIEYASGSHCLINATPMGLKKSDPMPITKEYLRKGQLVCDLVYNPPLTPLLRAAKARGAMTMSGLGMLLFQGVIAFEIWTGRKAPAQVMKSALVRQMRGMT